MDRRTKIIILWISLVILIGICTFLGYKLYEKNTESRLASENLYNQALYEMADYLENVDNYLAKSVISTSSKHGAETLTSLWREANLAQTYLSMLPIESQELEKTQKFLNQVSDYSYSLSRKNIDGERLNEEDLKNLEELHKLSIELTEAVNQIIYDLNAGTISWEDLTKDKDVDFAQQVNSSIDFAGSMEDNFHQYEGLIYDGAYSEHITSADKKGLTGDKISEEDAEKKVKEFIGEGNVKEIKRYGLTQNASIQSYIFSIKTNRNENIMISITEQGGHILSINSDRKVEKENLSFEDANSKGKSFLEEKGYPNMEQTYYLKESNIITINYAYSQDGVIMYPDLIKVKIALDDGEILGMEATGYLNNHTQRDISQIKITKEQAKEKINKNLDIQKEDMAIIPTKWKTEILCYEFKGKVDDTEYLVYINSETGEEEDILVITNTPNGVLTM